MKKILIVAALQILAVISQGQDILMEYVRYGIENNLALRQKKESYRRSIESLKEARSLFYPGISFNARYTLSEGGRVIDFPIGDLLNPVYSTLNSLTASNLFPVLENQEIKFLRPREHETKIRVAQPVFNTDIYYNSRIKKELTVYEEADADQYKRELVAEIKKAWYNLAMADGILRMLAETRQLLLENVRVNRRLVENDKLTRDNLYRSEAELSKFEQELQNAGKNRILAAAYFNFLLNKPLDDTVIIVQPAAYPLIADLTGDFKSSAIDNREEIRKLQQYNNIAGLHVKMNQSGRLPDIFVVVDYGFQGEEYRFNNKQDYVQASAVLTWNLFSGFQNKFRIQQAMIDKSIAEARLEEAKKSIELQVLNTLNELLTAEKGIEAAETRLLNAKEGFRLVNRKFEEGQASLIEFLDARTNLTQAEENLIISRFTYLSCYAEFEKVAAIDHQQY
jgi:outer membrane protein TolC